MKPIKIGTISNSQNGEVFFVRGIAPCLLSGGNGHDATIPKILVVYEKTNIHRSR